MKNRIKKLENISKVKENRLYVLVEEVEGSYRHWNKDKEETYTTEEVEKLQEDKNNFVLLVVWGKS